MPFWRWFTVSGLPVLQKLFSGQTVNGSYCFGYLAAVTMSFHLIAPCVVAPAGAGAITGRSPIGDQVGLQEATLGAKAHPQ
jgi:hypothetical protein